MALVTPIINNIPAFDATESMTITFTANGGDQIVKNEIQIINNATNVVVYSNIQTTYALGQIVPANTLANGNYYKVEFRTYDILDNVSEWSNYQPFYCYSLPNLSFNISDGQTIYTPNFDLTLTYSQTENERLESAVIYYYDINNNLISTSGNLFNSNLPPVVFQYPLRNFENNKTYKLQANGITINGTSITTGLISFHTNYETIENGAELYPIIDSCNGYINIKSAPVISALEGENEFNPETLSYIEKEDDVMVDLTSVVGELNVENSYSPWIRWYDITPISNAFLFRLWFYPARASFKVAELISTDESNRITITFNRGRTQDYLCIRTNDGTQIDKELGTICNGNTKVFLWLKIISNTWDVQTEILENPTTVFEWNNNDNNNINYNISTDINYVGEDYGSYVPKRTVYRVLNGAFDSVVIGNGIFDELDLSININKPYSSDIPQKDISSVLFIRFNNSIENDAPTGYTKATLQRKDDSMITWFNLSNIEISSDVPTEIEYNDYLIPNGIKQTYGLTIYQGEVPSDTYTIDVIPKWGRIFLSDNSENYKLNYAVIYSNGSQNIQNGVLMPIAATYPTVIENAEGNYRSGSLQFKVLGYQFEIDKTLNRNSIVQQTNDILAFLTNKKPKCIKDYNGNIFICRVINSPQISYDANWGNGITIISFDWVEQAKYNKYDEMVEMNIIDNVIPEPTPPIPPTPPTPTPIEPFVEKVFLFNGNDPDTIYPTQGIYEYDMYFGEKGDVNSASFYMPTDNYNIILYKMNNITQLIPQKQHIGNDYLYNLYFKESLDNTDNGKIDIIVQDENNNTISYTFNFIYEAGSSDYVTDSDFYTNDNSEIIITKRVYEDYDLPTTHKCTKKTNDEAYSFIATYWSDDYEIMTLRPMFVSLSPQGVAFTYEKFYDNTLIEQQEYTWTQEYTDEYGRTWFISFLSDEITTEWVSSKLVSINNSNIVFAPNDKTSETQLYSPLYITSNFLGHLYNMTDIYHENPLPSIPIGATATIEPVLMDKVQVWLECANIWGVFGQFTSLSDVLSEGFIRWVLFNSNNASNYLVRINDATFINEICENGYYVYESMHDIGQNDYCADLLLSSNIWGEPICNSLYYNEVLDFSNPNMTSNTMPSGICSCSPNNNEDAWKCFDGSSEDWVRFKNSTEDSESFVQYEFSDDVNIYRVGIINNIDQTHFIDNITMKIQGSNDGVIWNDLYVRNNYRPQGNNYTDYYVFNKANYNYFRIWFDKAMITTSSPFGTYYQSSLETVKFYGR